LKRLPRWLERYPELAERVGQARELVDVHRDNGKRFVARAEEKLTAFLELESAIRRLAHFERCRKLDDFRFEFCLSFPFRDE